MRCIRPLVAAVCFAAATGFAQRASVAPEAFLQDLHATAAISRLGGALLEADGRQRDWGDYCRAAQELANRGEFRQAIRMAARALYLGETRFGNRGAPVIYASNDIATAYFYAGDAERASTWAERTLAAIAGGYEERFARDVAFLRANAHRIRAVGLSERGQHEAALAELQRAQEALPSTRSERDAGELQVTRVALLLRAGRAAEAHELAGGLLSQARRDTLLGIARAAGETSLARGDGRTALRHFRMALAAAGEAKDTYQLLMAQAGVFRALHIEGEEEAARNALAQLLQGVEQVRIGFHSYEMRTALHGSLQSLYDEAVAFHAADGNAEAALAASEASRARAMLDLQAKMEDAARAPAARPRSLAEIRARLPAGQVLVVFHQLPSQLVAWSVTADTLTMKRLPLAAQPLRDQVAAFRTAIERQEPGVRTQAQALHAALLAPLALPAGPLVLVPHKALHLLPFQALHDGTGWLIERQSVATVLSASLLEPARFAAAEARLTALGNPDLGRPEFALPGAEREVQALGALYPRASVLVKADATKQKLRAAAPGAEVVHLAAHAVVDEIDPMYSVIKLATTTGATLQRQASDLEARELAALDLGRAQLVTLSACSSGLGTVAGGDEFMGFKRAVFAAGARSALVSLWPVDDDATERLMTGFHRAWHRASRSEAARTAQLDLLRDPRFAHPYFWAPFTLVGDPG